jgi:hypothetical protein
VHAGVLHAYAGGDVGAVGEQQLAALLGADARRKMQRAARHETTRAHVSSGDTRKHSRLAVPTHVRPLSSTVVASTSRPPASISVRSAASPLRALAHQRASNSFSTSSATLRAGSLRARVSALGRAVHARAAVSDRREQACACQESATSSFHLMRYSTRMAFWPSSGTRRTPVMQSTSEDCGSVRKAREGFWVAGAGACTQVTRACARLGDGGHGLRWARRARRRAAAGTALRAQREQACGTRRRAQRARRRRSSRRRRQGALWLQRRGAAAQRRRAGRAREHDAEPPAERRPRAAALSTTRQSRPSRRRAPACARRM